MAFQLSDVKKTVRARSDGEHYIHPKLLAGPAIAAQVDLALAYFNARLGRARHEFDAEMLVRFFGNPKVARGLVTCLSATYRWRARDFAEVLAPRELAWLSSHAVHTPGDLRLFLYDRLNAEGSGFLGTPRDGCLQPLARRLRLAPAKLDQLVALDAEENAVLVRVGAVPAAAQVVALYNYHAVSTLLRHSAWVEITCDDATGRAQLHTACAAQQVELTESEGRFRLQNRADLFGSYARWGGRLLRALLQAGAGTPGLLSSGRASVPLPGKRGTYVLERETLHALTARTGIVRYADTLPDLREEWTRQRAASRSEGWRLIASPEPVLSGAGLAVAPFSCRRGEVEVLLWPVNATSQYDDVDALSAAGIDVLPLLDGSGGAGAAVPAVHARADDVASIVLALNEGLGGRRAAPAEQALEGLLVEVKGRGFVAETYVMNALGCVTRDELRVILGALDPARATYVVGTGLCSPAFVEEMRKGLRRRQPPRPAA